MGRSKGPAVIDRQLVYASPSSMECADVEGEGCPLKWYYRYVERRPKKKSKSKDLGNQIHDEMERYLKTGESVLGRLSRELARFAPTPGPDLLVEHWIEPGELDLDGVPIIGKVDLTHQRPTWVSDTGLVLEREPGTIIVKDWKSTGDRQWFKQPETLQTDAYGEWARRRFNPTHVRLSLAYTLTKGRPEAAQFSRRYTADELAERWRRRLPVIQDMREAARCDRPDQVKINSHACEAFGGCDYYSICERGQKRSLADWLGEGASMDLLSQLNGLDDDVASEMAALQAQEQAARANPIEAPVTTIESAGCGFPTMAGAAAQAYADLKTAQGDAAFAAYSGQGLAGTGQLGPLTIDKVEQFQQLADQLVAKGKAKAPTTAPTAPIVPPQAPAAPAPVAAPPQAPAAPAPVAAPPQAPAAGDPSPSVPNLPPAVIEDTSGWKMSKKVRAYLEKIEGALHGAGQDAQTVDTAMATALAEAQARVRDLEAMVDRMHKTADERAAAVTLGLAPATGGVRLMVDCVVEGTESDARPLRPIIDEFRAALRERYSVGDIRSAPQDSPLGYNKWRGIMAAFAREAMATGKIPDGWYYLDTRGDEVAEVVAEAMRPACKHYSRGIR